ncbi:hypothetical protein L198_03882 [Cryptococcus wingfieldii CBS 7118]|uniref:Uncharacterized protein n=1 Tax=Cryptococcus wingfieldii CBS 7118 TaxID=1295528 RepID=A0A1E3J8Y3_9TREE|nr:hypothetical protein L198_03882 [Cryptococcus wingfieldii CBS 7118]ODN97319.1 hypothetical protein L198_03882 [Cryptococcus wingfieldii CBS 7118]
MSMFFKDNNPTPRRTFTSPNNKKFAITPVKAVAQTSLSHASPLFRIPSFDHPSATAGAGPSQRQSGSNLRDHGGRISPTKKIARTFGSASTPVLTIASGRAEIEHRRYGSSDLERVLDRVFAKHDKASQDLGGRVPVFSKPKGSHRTEFKTTHGHHTKAWSTGSTASGLFPNFAIGASGRGDDQSDVFSEILTPNTLRSPTTVFTDLGTLSEYDPSTAGYIAPDPLHGRMFQGVKPRAKLSWVQQYDNMLPAMGTRSFEEGIHPEGLVEENTEVVARIVDLSARVQSMITEGEGALRSAPPILPPTSSHSPDENVLDRTVGTSVEEADDTGWDLCDALDLAISIGIAKRIELDFAAEAVLEADPRDGECIATAKRRKDSQCLGERISHRQTETEMEGHVNAVGLVRSRSLGLLRYGGVDVM